jgi:hypothetical protein
VQQPAPTGPGLLPSRLTRSDRASLAMLSEAGDGAAVDDVKRTAVAARIAPAALRRFLRTSPLVVSDGLNVRTIGSAPARGSAAARSARLAQLEPVV